MPYSVHIKIYEELEVCLKDLEMKRFDKNFIFGNDTPDFDKINFLIKFYILATWVLSACYETNFLISLSLVGIQDLLAHIGLSSSTLGVLRKPSLKIT